MVMGDTSFYTVAGEEINRSILVQEMIDLFNEKYPDAVITDFNEGSVIRNILESLAVDAYHIMQVDNDVNKRAFLSTATGNYLDLHGQDIGSPRDLGSFAWGIVTFSIPAVESFEITIPEDTVLVDSETGLQFVTNMECKIGVGEVSVDCPVHSVVVGDNCNANIGALNTFYNTKPYNNLSVTNNSALTGGKDSETDDKYRERLLKIKQTDNFGSIGYYLDLGFNINGVHDIIIADSNTHTGKIIVNGDNKPLPDEVLALVVAAFNDETNLVYNHAFEVEAVSYTTVNLEIECSVSQELEDSTFKNALTNLFDGNNTYKGMSINEPLSKYLIMTCLEEEVFGLLQITDMTSDNQSFSKLTPDTNKVLKLGTVTITQNIED